jgi:hypothetical protein
MADMRTVDRNLISMSEGKRSFWRFRWILKSILKKWYENADWIM